MRVSAVDPTGAWREPRSSWLPLLLILIVPAGVATAESELSVAMAREGAPGPAEDHPLPSEARDSTPQEGPIDTEGDEAPPTDALKVGASSGTVTSALQGKEGVRIQTLCTHCNSANIQVGGLSKDLAPMSRDGYPLFGGLATSLMLNFLPSDSVAEVKVVKGPGDACEPASAAGGVIRLQEATPEEMPWADLILAGGSFDLRDATARLGGPMAGWLSGSVVYGQSSADPVDDDGDGWNDVTSVDREFADGRLRFTPGRKHVIDLGASWIDEENLEGRGAFDIFVAGRDLTPAWTREDSVVDRREYRGSWQWRVGDGGMLDIGALEARRHQEILSQATRNPVYGDPEALFPRANIHEINRWGRVRFRRPLGMTWRVDAGAESDYQRVSVEEREVFDYLFGREPEPNLFADYVESWSSWASAGWSPSPRWSLDLGVRYDHGELKSENTVPIIAQGASPEDDAPRTFSETSPRLTVRFYPASGWTLRLIAGRTFRLPRPMYQEICCGQRYPSVVDTTVETAATWGFEGIYQPSPRWRASLYVARNDFDDYILRLVAESTGFIQTYALANIPDARAETAEVALRWTPIDRITVDGSIGWLSFYNRGGEDVLVRASPPSSGGLLDYLIPMNRIPYYPVRTGSFSVSVATRRGFVFSGQTSYTGTMLIQQYGLPGLRKELRETPAFWLVNLSAELPLHRQLGLRLNIDNASDRIQNDLGDFTTDYNWGPLTGRAFRAALHWHLDRGGRRR